MKLMVCLLLLSFYTFSATAYSEDSVIKSDTIVGANEKVDYRVTQNRGDITVQLSTRDNKTIMTMLHFGVTVFFDLKGKDKEDIAVKYPLEPLKLPMKSEGRTKEDFESEAEVNQIKKDINKVITSDFPEEAEYVFFDKKDDFNVLLNSLNIKASYSYNEKTGTLTYQLTIPKEKLKEKSKSDDFSKLKIGVKTVMPEKGKKSGPTQGLEGGGGSRPSGRGGSGGGPGGGGGGRPTQNQQGSDKGDSKGPTVIDFWFEAPM